MKWFWRVLMVLLLISWMATVYFLMFERNRSERETATVHSIVVEKMEALGKLELVTYYFRDIVQHEELREWLPDSKVVLVVEGEAVGCIDLSQLDSTSIVTVGDSLIRVTLPEPEICYAKVDHEKSRVYDTEYTFWDEAQLVDEAYREAERQIFTSAQQSGMLLKCKQQAPLILRPMLESISGKEVQIVFHTPIQIQPEVPAAVRK